MNGQNPIDVWQYLIVEDRVQAQPKPEQRHAEADALARRCGELGAQGWELVSVAPLARTLGGDGLTTEVRLFFKRRAR